MKITRRIDTTNAKYSLDELNEEQLAFIQSSLTYYCGYICHKDRMDKDTPLGEVMDKIERMRESSVTIIN